MEWIVVLVIVVLIGMWFASTYNSLVQLRNAVKDFLATKEGKEAVKETCEDFNWGDVFTYIPEEFFEKYGIHSSWASETLLVNQDEVLCD